MTTRPVAGEAPEWNPRYLAYCADVSGLSPDAQLAQDRETYPGGRMCGFTIWISQRWREWRKGVGVGPDVPLSTDQTEAFDCWLSGRGWSL